MCASINLGTFFYYNSAPEDTYRFMFEYFQKINRTMVPWHDAHPTAPRDLELLRADSLDRVISRFSTQPR